MTTAESNQDPTSRAGDSPASPPAQESRSKKTGKWDKLAKGFVVCLAILLFGWMAWQASFVREWAVTCLGNMGSPGVSLLRKIVHDDDPHVRWAAQQALVRIGPEAVPSLVGALTDRKATVRAEAAYALGLLEAKGKDASPPLVAALGDEDARVRAKAAVALWLIDADTTQTIPVLKELAKDPDVEVRVQAVEALGLISRGDDTVVALFLQLANDPEARVRAKVTENLSRVSAPKRPVLAGLQ